MMSDNWTKKQWKEYYRVLKTSTRLKTGECGQGYFGSREYEAAFQAEMLPAWESLKKQLKEEIKDDQD